MLPSFEEITSDVFNLIVDKLIELGMIWAIFGLIIVMILQAIIAPIVSEAILASAGGAFDSAFPSFGIYAAIIGGIIGSLLGAIITFYIARWIQKQLKIRIVDKYQDKDTQGETETQEDPSFMTRLANFLAKFIDEDSEDFIEVIEEKGFLFVLIGRLLPFVPFDAVSYGSGLTRIHFKDYIIATTIGTVPRVIFYVLVGSVLGDQLEDDFTIFMWLMAVLVIVILGLYKLTLKYVRTNYTNNEKTKDQYPSAED